MLPVKLQRILEELEAAGGRQERIDLLVGYAERFLPVTSEVATAPYSEGHRVPGCESEAFVWALPLPNGKVKLYFAVENPQGISAKALCSILDDSLSGLSPEEIQSVGDDVVFRIFGNEISMGKSIGLVGILRMAKAMAGKLA
jgi:cysteine desulfuration protein SufE